MPMDYLTGRIESLLRVRGEASATSIATALEVDYGNILTLLRIREQFRKNEITNRWQLKVAKHDGDASTPR